MNDEELVELIERTIDDYFYASDMPIAERIAAALRSAGFQVFKPEDCEWVVKDEEFIADTDCFLVPIPGGRDERNY